MFEQSGTFKNIFKKYGYKAKDYDIANDYGETDVVVDLYNEIERAYLGISSIFDKISTNDVVLAFFPCTRFEDQIIMALKGVSYQMAKYSDEQKLNYALYIHQQLEQNYKIITKLAIVCLRKNLKLMIENPRGSQHYLTRYWPIEPKIIDSDRSKHGDYYKKPTQYWFVNFEPKSNVINMEFTSNKRGTIEGTTNNTAEMNRQVARSEIHPQYVEWFIRSYLIDNDSEFELS